ncbi:hypothetical protein L226DRAFT_356484 [Lentinus tigrinus ALCF2SS1-7]|uniref:uncharacterized protein n=1 Tax=Lentinus tigrinus ALCF2SS1-7 TaxID=1328758 RepID=UPI001165D4BD|nr:hypothetical protein L226DRAFT_356484 [Lentinus tigrinus ALCF2SS1-7]
MPMRRGQNALAPRSHPGKTARACPLPTLHAPRDVSLQLPEASARHKGSAHYPLISQSPGSLPGPSTDDAPVSSLLSVTFLKLNLGIKLDCEQRRAVPGTTRTVLVRRRDVVVDRCYMSSVNVGRAHAATLGELLLQPPSLQEEFVFQTRTDDTPIPHLHDDRIAHVVTRSSTVHVTLSVISHLTSTEYWRCSRTTLSESYMATRRVGRVGG